MPKTHTDYPNSWVELREFVGFKRSERRLTPNTIVKTYSIGAETKVLVRLHGNTIVTYRPNSVYIDASYGSQTTNRRINEVTPDWIHVDSYGLTIRSHDNTKTTYYSGVDRWLVDTNTREVLSCE